MAVLTHSRLETTPAGTANLGGIIAGNFEQLEAIFAPTTGSGDTVFALIAKALLRNNTLPADAARIEWDSTAGKFVARAAQGTLAAGATVTADAKGPALQTCTLNADTTIAIANMGAGRRFDLALTCDATPRALTWPSGAVNLTGATLPASLTAGQTMLASIISTTGSNSGLLITSALLT